MMKTQTNKTEKPQTTIDLARERLVEAARQSEDFGTRYEILSGILNATETYHHQLDWLRRNIQDEVLRVETQGFRAIYESVLSTSLIDDVKTAAAKVCALRSVAPTAFMNGPEDALKVLGTQMLEQ